MIKVTCDRQHKGKFVVTMCNDGGVEESTYTNVSMSSIERLHRATYQTDEDIAMTEAAERLYYTH